MYKEVKNGRRNLNSRFLHGLNLFPAAAWMQAALRAGLQELARGVSTGVVVWAGVGKPTCYCTCEAPPKPPDCLCGSAQTSFIDFIKEGAVLSIVLVFWSVSLFFAFWLGRSSAAWGFSLAVPSVVPAAQSGSGNLVVGEALKALVRSQTAKARARAGSGNGSP